MEPVIAEARHEQKCAGHAAFRMSWSGRLSVAKLSDLPKKGKLCPGVQIESEGKNTVSFLSLISRWYRSGPIAWLSYNEDLGKRQLRTKTLEEGRDISRL